jgi:hypothetical protein
MSNYSKTTDFAAKDSLPSGDSGKIIRGSEFETEFDAISTAIATKADAADPTFTGTVTIDGLTVNGNTVLGNAATDTVTVTADIASNLIPSADDTYDLGAVGAEWNDLYVDGVAYIDTIDGAATSGDFTFTGASYNAVWDTSDNALEFADSAKATFGATGDLQIYHSGTHSFITDVGTGNLYLRGTNLLLTSAAGETYADFTADGAARLYHNGSAKLATTSTGIDVTGTVTADGLSVNSGATNQGAYFVSTDSGQTIALSDSASSNLLITDNNGFNILTDGDANSAGANATRAARFKPNKDVEFYEDTGTTAKFFWDASAERLGIGTSSPNSPLEVLGTSAGGEVEGLRLTNSSTTTNTSSSIVFNLSTVSADSAKIAAIRTNSPTSSDTELVFSQSRNGTLTERMRINSSGNVGIGTSSPASALEVADSGVELRVTDTRNQAFTAGDTIASLGFYSDDTSGNSGGANNLPRGAIDVVTTSTFGSTHDMVFRTRGDETATASEKVRINSIGNVGIGTTSPAKALDIIAPNGSQFRMANNDTDATLKNAYHSVRHFTNAEEDFVWALATSSTSNTLSLGGGTGLGNAATSIQFFTAANNTTITGSERMRIDSSGNVLVGTTNTTPGVGNTSSGVSMRGGLGSFFSRPSATPLHVNRSTDDGTIVDFRKDGANVGGIGSKDGDLFIHTGTTGLRFVDGGNSIRPVTSNGNVRDNAIDLGGTTSRWKDLYLSGGISFNPNAAANKLDDYEEGTFTPTLYGSTTAGTPTYVTQSGFYTKIGNLVTVHIRLQASAISGAAGNIQIGGLPFTSTGLATGTALTSGLNWPANTSQLTSYIDGTGTHLRIFRSDDDTSWGDVAIVDESQDYLITVAYRTAA